MSKIALLVPREEMLYLAHNILQEKKYAIGDMRVIQTENTVTEARNAISSGATILIARGLQASLIKQYTDVPVVEITATAQEMALLVVRARQILKKERPFIAAIGFKNMFCDMTYFDTIYGIKLRTYFAHTGSELKSKAMEAIADGADLLIGGDVAIAAAKEAGVPSLFLSITEDSLRTAFSMAESMAFAMGAEKRSHAQIEALLDYSFNGVVNIDREGRITTLNPVMREILREKEEKDTVRGRYFCEIFPDVNREKFSHILKGEEESYASFIKAGQTSVFAILAPVKVGNETEGAILTCHKVKRQKEQKETERPLKGKGRIPGARGRFQDLCQASPAMESCVHLARLYAQAEQPLLLFGEPGTETRLLAECIHSESPASEGPFSAISCRGLSDQEQKDKIFGEKGAVYQLQGGSLLLEDIEELSLSNQYRLFQLIRFRTGDWEPSGTKPFKLRITGSTSLKPEEFAERMEVGSFRPDLYYLLSGLVLSVPPLRERPEDLEALTELYIKLACERYSRFHVLTQGAREAIRSFSWPGNLLQLESFLMRLILTAQKRSIDEICISRLLSELYPLSPGLPETDSPEKARILAALSKHQGNREKTAADLGISKATLWRRMKQYSIEEA